MSRNISLSSHVDFMFFKYFGFGSVGLRVDAESQLLQPIGGAAVEELEVIREEHAGLPVMSVIGMSTPKCGSAPMWKP